MSNKNDAKSIKNISIKNSKEIAKTNNENLFDLSLVNLQPSRELLDFYRRKVAELTGDHDGLMRRLEQLNETCVNGHILGGTVSRCEDEIAELQRALSDMQIYLFKEREQVLRLYAENDRLKIRELNDRKKVQHLLQLSGLTQSEVTYFIKDPPSKAVVQPNHAVTLVTSDGFTTSVGSSKRGGVSSKSINNSCKVETVSVLEHESLKRDLDSFKLQIQALQSQLEEQTKLYKEQCEALMEDRRIKQEETETQRSKDQEKIQTLSEKLKRTQELLYENTKDFLTQRGQYRENERGWIAEKDGLMRKANTKESGAGSQSKGGQAIDSVGLQGRAWSEYCGQASAHREEQHKAALKNLEYQLEQAQKMSEMYREQVIEMENELAQIREHEGATKEMYKQRSGKISERLQTMGQRYRNLERRRNLEVQGFQTDIANLRKKLKTLEKQLYTVTLSLGDNLSLADTSRDAPMNLDLAILKEVRHTATRSNHLSGQLKDLKAMMYGLEREVRHL